ncbi:hypothetical protein HAX54_051974, partial [Datura stramonium]|nr:hypothetical protein [Datura stramonium]
SHACKASPPNSKPGSGSVLSDPTGESPIPICEPPMKHWLQPIYLGVMITSTAQPVNHRFQPERHRTITGYKPEN